MRQILFLLISVFIISISINQTAQADCSNAESGDHVCAEGSTPVQEAAPPTEPGTAIPSAPPAPPLGSDQPIDYSQMSEQVQQDVMSNLTQETGRIEPGSCTERTIAPGGTIAIPFVYDGSTTAMNAAPGGTTRMFVSSMPGYDPLKRLSPGAQSDFYSPCHSQANLPQICDESTCWPDPNNENSLNLKNADTVVADPEANANQCPMVPGETYYLNLQNESSAPVSTNVGFGTSC